MTIKLGFDDREFRAALAQYQKLSSRDSARICNDKARDWLFLSARNTPKASRVEIDQVASQLWWPKKVAKELAKKQHGLTHKQFQREARKLSRKIITGRKRAITFARAGFVKAARKFPQPDPSRPGRKPARQPRVKFSSSILTNVTTANLGIQRDHLEARFHSEWLPSGRQEMALQNLLTKSFREGQRLVTRDMIKYIERKQIQRAKQVSATVRDIGKAVF